MKLHSIMLGSRCWGTILAALSAVLTAQAADYSTTVLSQGPVGYWRLNEAAQPPTPPVIAKNLGSLGAAGNGYYTNASYGFTPGAIAGEPTNACVQFYGTPDGNRVRIPYAQQWSPTTPYSVEFWAKPGQTAASVCPAACVYFTSTPANQRDGWLFYQADSAINTGNGWVFRQYNSSGLTAVTTAATNMTLNVNSWYHIVGVFDGSSLSLYVNGVLSATAAITGTARGNTNTAIPLAFGARSDGASGFFTYNGSVDEGAVYNTALTAAQVLAHYQAGTNPSTTGYRDTVLADNPVGYWRLDETDGIFANAGTLGAANRGNVIAGAASLQVGPRAPAYAGFSSANNAVNFDGVSGAISIPALKLNTNAMTISGWLKVKEDQTAAAGIFFSRTPTTISGLCIDPMFGGRGLGYVWAGSRDSYSWSPSHDWSFPSLPDDDWAYVALVVEPSQATLYLVDSTNYANFTWTSFLNNHTPQAFDGGNFIGWDSSPTNRYFKGMVDELAVFNRSLTAGELYTQYATAVGGVPPKLFTDPQPPMDPVYAGDTLKLVVDVGGTANLSYQWRKDGSAISGATKSFYTKEGVNTSDNGNYDCVVINPHGTLTSAAAYVTVSSAVAPTVTSSQGFYNRTLYTGATLSFSATAVGGGVTYQYYKNDTAIPSATNASYRVASVTTNNAGSYKLVVSNGAGNTTLGPVTIAIPSVATNSYEGLVIAAAPEAWWRLGEAPGSTNLIDAMGRHDGFYTNLDGAVPPVTLGAAGALGSDPDTAASFTPSGNAFGVVPFSTDLNPAAFTVEGWVKTTNLTATIAAFGSSDRTNGWYWQTYSGNWGGYHPSSYAPLAKYSTQAVLVSGEWTHLVVTFNPANNITFPWDYYINGVTDAYVWGGGTNANQSQPFIIGGRWDASRLASALFSGEVDEIAVYKRILSGTEVASHYQGRFGTTTPPYFTGSFTSQTLTVGKSVTNSTTAKGSLPITLRWYKDGALISGQTTNTLIVNTTSVTNSGVYMLVASNSVGTATQSFNLTVIAPVSYVNVTNGLVLHMEFENDAADTSGRGNNGTVTGSPAFVTGLVGSKALQYSTETDGSSVTSASYVGLGTPTDLAFGATTSFTISLWVKLPAGYTNNDLPFIGSASNSANGLGWVLCPTYGGGGWQWTMSDGTVNIANSGAKGTFNDGAWHHLVLTVDRSTKLASTYLDEFLVSTKDISSLGSIDSGYPITIGQDPTGIYAEVGTATLDDIGIWTRVLTPLEITQIYSAAYTAGHSFNTVQPYIPPVTLYVTSSGSTVTLSWSTGTLLESSSLSANATWTPVVGATAPSYTFTPTSTNKFYRVLVQ